LPSTVRLIMNNEFVNLPAGNYTLLKTMNAIVVFRLQQYIRAS